MTHALITRPLAEANNTAQLVLALGFTPIIDPLLTIEYRQEAAQELATLLHQRLQCIIVTSINGAKALARMTTKRNMLIIAVGVSTADTAQAEGFDNIRTGCGHVAGLMDEIKEICQPQGGTILYVSADAITLDMTKALTLQGFHTARIIAYHAIPSTELSAATAQLLTEQNQAIALFYSKRTADIFMQLSQAYDLSSMAAFALSEEIADRLRIRPWRGIYNPTIATQEALLSLVKDYAH